MVEPIELVLKNQSQKDLARLQDKIVAAMYNVDSDIVMHGGTAIWRCYRGNRFSEDVDVYVTAAQRKKLERNLTWELNKYQINMEYIKSSRRITVYDGSARTRLEAMDKPRGLRPISIEYERCDGTKFFVRTLKVEDFLSEKMDTYRRRRYMRDIYDLYFLIGSVSVVGRLHDKLAVFLRTLEPPLDEGVLKDLVYVGSTPTFNEIVNALGGKLK